ncbi:Chorion peroxidase [Fragariocoptes setiger]|uniref:Chorion peroxidase n=1 Tax=Fragariocoptes setiger TaxID=1670756 RepID=A0ABQ7S8R5_9ACAR|nr:Chorion peroxidase [Fragariocoptes setiger]
MTPVRFMLKPTTTIMIILAILVSLDTLAGKAVLGGAAKFASSLINRPKHWGVPDNEPLELSDNYNADQHRPPPFDENDFARPDRGRDRPPSRNRYDMGHHRKREKIPCRRSDGLNGVCRPLAACYHRYGPTIKYEIGGEQCPNGFSLTCCPRRNQARYQAQQQGSQSNEPSLGIRGDVSNGPTGAIISLDLLRNAIAQVFRGQQSSPETERSNEIEKSLVKEGLTLEKNSPSDLHQRFIRLRNTGPVVKLARDGLDFMAVAARLAQERRQQSEGTTETESSEAGNTADGEGPKVTRRRSQAPDIDFSQTDLASRCPGDPVCPAYVRQSPFRTHDGSCNNLRHTAWGRANTPYTRILPPDYEDGVDEIRRTGATGAPLPNARSVSLATVNWNEKQDARSSVLLMQWGQFIDHDLTLAATTPMLTPQGTSIDCCNRRLLSGDSRFRHPACISILLPDNDPFYAKFQVGCMNLVRNAPAPPIGCRLRHREQLNQLTHFIDGSMIYGNDADQAISLRQRHGGLLKSSRINGVEFLPFDGRIGEGCILPTAGIRRGMRCFVAGDNRVNELSGLVTTHALMLREHNRIARALWSMNANEWDDERIYQETRRIVVAIIQHITYNEWLPLILGPTVMRDFKLELKSANARGPAMYATDYDHNTNPSIINEFAGAAYRLHSLVQGAFNFQTEQGQLIQQFKLRNIFNNPASLYREGNFDACIHAMINERSQSVDPHFTEELTNHLFQDTNSSFGMDLVAVNIQRGRDHGLPGYNHFRQACGLTRIRSFQQLDLIMVPGAGRIFSQLYAHVDDIDLFIAGNYERKLRDALVGPVFACIIGEQFRRLKVADRYWYENSPRTNPGAFSPDQLAEIKRATMARLVCDNSEAIERSQALAFLVPSEWNPKVACEELPWIDLRYWRNSFGGEPNFASDLPDTSEFELASRRLDTDTDTPSRDTPRTPPPTASSADYDDEP